MKRKNLFVLASATLLSVGMLVGCGGGDTPVDPSKPTEPTQPTEPTAPTAPTEPTEPTVPTAPTKPTIPTDPSVPTVPTQPTEPTEPSEEPELANGARSFVYRSGEDKNEILGVLEKYAVENKLTGLTLYGNGGYVMYNPSVQKGTNTYVPGFGFGVLSSGDLTADLEGEANQAWKRYYHSYETDDPGSLNYMDDKGSVVGNLIGYVTDSYFTTYLNEEGNGYDWVGGLSKVDRPIAVNTDPFTGLATTFRFPVKVGAELKYRTASNQFSAFDGREVQLQDYITPYQIYYTKSYGLARSADNLNGTGSIAGSEAYYNASGEGFNADAWENIGIKAVVDNGESYLEFTFNQACSPFYAMYYLSSGMYAPVPEDFILAIGGGDFAEGVKAWGKSSSNGNLSPLDHWLSTGPYYVERWDADQQIVFAKNDNFDDHDGEYYKIQGVHLNILTAAKTDREAALNEFLANRIHACGIPSTQLDNYKSDPRTTMTADDSTFKLNLNTCDEETWDALFGEKGSITQTPASDYWNLKPAMHNKDFVSGLSFALNRKELANTLGRTPSADYFASAYMQDPENGISYNATDAHKRAVEDLIGEKAGTDEYGYSLEKAKASFLKAANDMVDEGLYEAGDTIEIEIAWQTEANVETEHAIIKNYIETAFNIEENPLRLNVVPWVGAQWSDVYYNKMMLGQFDIGFGSISGNTYDPLNFLEVLKSDNSSGFTLNWGLDTNSVDGSIVWEDEVYSFDALWTAADQGAYIENGANSAIPYQGMLENVSVDAEAGIVTVTLLVYEPNIDGGAISTKFAGGCFYGYVELSNDGYREVYNLEDEPLVIDENVQNIPGLTRYQVTFSLEELVGTFTENSVLYSKGGYAGFDLYYYTTMFGVTSVKYQFTCGLGEAGLDFLTPYFPVEPTEPSEPSELTQDLN